METYDWGTKLFQWLFSYHIVFFFVAECMVKFQLHGWYSNPYFTKVVFLCGIIYNVKREKSTFSFFMLPNIWASCEEISLNLSYHSWVALSWGSHRHNGNGRLPSNDRVTNLLSTKATVRNLRLFPKMAAKRHNTCFCDVPLHLLI